jgi:hypothetical protein
LKDAVESLELTLIVSVEIEFPPGVLLAGVNIAEAENDMSPLVCSEWRFVNSHHRAIGIGNLLPLRAGRIPVLRNRLHRVTKMSRRVVLAELDEHIALAPTLGHELHRIAVPRLEVFVGIKPKPQRYCSVPILGLITDVLLAAEEDYRLHLLGEFERAINVQDKIPVGQAGLRLLSVTCWSRIQFPSPVANSASRPVSNDAWSSSEERNASCASAVIGNPMVNAPSTIAIILGRGFIH